MLKGLAIVGKSITAFAIVGFAGTLAFFQHSGPASSSARDPASLTSPRDDEQSCQGAAHLVIPVGGVTATALQDTFGDARAEGRRHDAIDIMAPLGTPVVAAAPGRVEKLFLSAAGGKTVYVRAVDGRTIYYYAHLDRYAPGLSEGRSVRASEAIGKVGFSGNANPEAPHLHFAVIATTPEKKWWDQGEALNPYPLLMNTTGKCK